MKKFILILMSGLYAISIFSQNISKFSQGKDYETGAPIPPVIYHYNNYTVICGYGEKGSNIGIYDHNKELYYTEGGDGYYQKIDTADFNKDGTPDFIVQYGYGEPNFDLEIIMSKLASFKCFELGEFFSFDGALCKFQNIDNIDFNKIRDFYIIDNTKIVTNVYVINNQINYSTCTQIINVLNFIY